MNKLYRRNNNGAPTVWWAELDSCTNSITVFYGLVRGNIRKEVYAVTQKDGQKELESRYNDKIKQGYTYLNELCDMQGLPPVENGDNDTLFNFLNTYLPKDLSNGNSNLLLPMLAKTYNGNVWKKVSCMYGQYKINGLRCIVTAYTQNDMFKPIRLRFQSREGLTWHTLSYLEDYLLATINTNIIDDMINGFAALDGEVYLPGYTVNQINHFVKDANCVQNKLLQFWCYDIMMEGNQTHRNTYRYHIKMPTSFNNIKEHYNNKERLIILPIGYTPLGNSVEEDASKSKQIAEAIVCKECIDKLDSETCFIACDMDKDNYITATYDTLWIRNKGLKEFFKELDSIQPIKSFIIMNTTIWLFEYISFTSVLTSTIRTYLTPFIISKFKRTNNIPIT
jgi:hypothetical protein